MVKIKTPKKKIMFNMQERELCGICNFPHGFCKHTIEKEYKDACPDTPLKKEDIWQLVRSHAIDLTHKRNLMWYADRDINEIKSLMNNTNEKIKQLEDFITKLKERQSGGLI